jgi:FAD-dependent urate hydroxylase
VTLPLLIIGAGPFGLALSAHAHARGLEHGIVGEPMEFWRRHMPAGMNLRSACDWHLDVDGIHTIDRYLAEQGLSCADVLPMSRARYLDYVDWFMKHTRVKPINKRVRRLDRFALSPFRATLHDGTSIDAEQVVVALGFGYFKHLPHDVVSLLSCHPITHSSDLVDFEALSGKRVLVIGGRMAAFEWAALISEAGAASVDISYRHATPSFEVSEWSWVPELLARMTEDPSWYGTRSQEEKDAIAYHMWSEGRLQLEPWLGPRIAAGNIRLWPHTRVAASGPRSVTLDNGQEIAVDHIVMATGYQADVSRVPFVRDGNLWDQLLVNEGQPALDTGFQSSVEGLFFTSILAARDFGPFFGFTVSARFSARRIIDRVLEAHAGAAQRSV